MSLLIRFQPYYVLCFPQIKTRLENIIMQWIKSELFMDSVIKALEKWESRLRDKN